MESVGIRELKQNLSRYIKKIKLGERIIVTDRKKKVAIISPFGTETEDDKILHLIKSDIAYWSGNKPLGLRSRAKSKGKKVSDAVMEDRR